MTSGQNAGDAGGPSRWPQDTWLAFAPVLVFEAWSERSAREGKILTTPRPPLPAAAGGILDTRNYTWTLYGGKVGLGRLLEICDRHACRTTIVANGLAIERHPSLIRQAAQCGHEIAAHGYDQGEPLYLMDRRGRERDIQLCRRIIEETTGEAPQGWMSPGLGYTEDTLELLGQLRFLWHGDHADADLPYSIDVLGRPLVEIPVNMDLNDNATYVRHGQSPLTHLEKIRCTLEVLYRERNRRRALLSPVFHCHNSGRPMGSWAFEETLKLVRGYSSVWFTTYGEIARSTLESPSGS